jgi:hypothetical protein
LRVIPGLIANSLVIFSSLATLALFGRVGLGSDSLGNHQYGFSSATAEDCWNEFSS